MSDELANASLANARSIFVVANTPLYLLRHLVVDPVVAKLHGEIGPTKLFELIKAAISKEPQSFDDLVRPYVMLVALARGPNAALLRKASELNAPHHEWFQYIARTLLSNATSNNTITISPSPQVNSGTISTASLSTTVQLVIP